MRVLGSWSLLLAASFTSSLALAEAPVVAPAPPPDPAPPLPPAPPPPTPAPVPPPADSAPATSASEVTPSETTVTAPGATPNSANGMPLAEARADQTSPVGVNSPPLVDDAPTDFRRNFDALPLTLEARVGFNARLGSSFDDAAEEDHWGASYALAVYLAWKPQFALGLELEHQGLGGVRALSGQNSIDSQYTATGAWLGARVFPIRAERLDFFVNLRIGLVMQYVNAFGTRADNANITVPAQSFACSAWDGPGIGLGGALGLAYRLGRHFSFVSRVDLNGERLSGEAIGTCADGIGSVASLSGSVGLAYEFETAPK